MAVLVLVTLIHSGCAKDGATGPAGADGVAGTDGNNGINGVDANQTCKQCHKSIIVEQKSTEFELSKHSYGEASFEEAGNTACAPCHESEGFKFVCENNTPVTFTLNASTGKYVNNYASDATHAIGQIGCFTCHSKLHTTYTAADTRPFTSIAPVKMTMWAGAKTIDLTQNGGNSNLCVKCHQPRPIAKKTDGNVLDYDALVSNPTGIFYDSTLTTNVLVPGYRTDVHNGTVGAIFAGQGGIQFAGSLSYGNSSHTSLASCQNCHMAPLTGKAGGHTFFTKGNFNGCNVTGCHSYSPLDANSPKFTYTRSNTKTLLAQLAAKLQVGGIEIMNKNPDATTNLWAGITDGNYDGYLNIYDPINNPNGPLNNGGTCFRNTAPSSSWTTAQQIQNLTYPRITLTNAQMGAIINFQMCLREFSLGIHNTSYSKALLTNTIAIL